MQKKYRTTHYGVAAYLLSKGLAIDRLEQGTNRQGKEVVFIEFNTDIPTGKDIADDFFNGTAYGDLKRYHDCLGQIKRSVYEFRG